MWSWNGKGESLRTWLGPNLGTKFKNHQVGATEAEMTQKAVDGKGWVHLKRPRQAGREQWAKQPWIKDSSRRGPCTK